MALDQPAHHVGLARRPERGAGFLRLLDRDQAVDDLAALHQQAVHGLVDAVDLVAQIGERGRVVGRLVSGMAWHRYRRRRIDRWARPAKSKKTLTCGADAPT